MGILFGSEEFFLFSEIRRIWTYSEHSVRIPNFDKHVQSGQDRDDFVFVNARELLPLGETK